jgi:hypothetical protein
MVTVLAGVLVIVLRSGPVRQLLRPRMLQPFVEMIEGEPLMIARCVVAQIMGRPTRITMLVAVHFEMVEAVTIVAVSVMGVIGLHLEMVEAAMVITMLVVAVIIVRFEAVEAVTVIAVLIAAVIVFVLLLVERDFIAVMQLFPPPMRRRFHVPVIIVLIAAITRIPMTVMIVV